MYPKTATVALLMSMSYICKQVPEHRMPGTKRAIQHSISIWHQHCGHMRGGRPPQRLVANLSCFGVTARLPPFRKNLWSRRTLLPSSYRAPRIALDGSSVENLDLAAPARYYPASLVAFRNDASETQRPFDNGSLPKPARLGSRNHTASVQASPALILSV